MDESIGSKLKKYFIIVIFFANILLSEYTGGYAGAGFNLESCARDVSLAGATVADGTLGFFPFSNPALLHNMKTLSLSSSYFMLPLERYGQVISISKNLPPSAGISLSLFRSGTDDIEGRNSMNQITEKSYSTSDYYGMISFGVSPGKSIAFGVNIKAYYSSLEISSPFADPASNGVFIDIGIIYKPLNNTIIGYKYENMGTTMKWKTDEGGHNQFSHNENIPKKHSIGFNYIGFENIKLMIQQDLLVIDNQSLNYRTKLAAEYRIKVIDIRAGSIYSNGYFIPRFGLGFEQKIFSDNVVSFDYSLDLGKASEGINNNFSITISY